VTDSDSRISEILRDLDLSDPAQSGELLGLVYDELRAIAANRLRHERPGHTLQPTALVHEAWMRLAQARAVDIAGRGHFFRIAARAMRQVLIDSARRHNAERRGGGWQRVTLTADVGDGTPAVLEVLALHDALERLGRLDSSLEQLIELRFFTGLTVAEAAGVLGLSRRKVAQDWAAARLWLQRELA
jgi:RNA polymerase sigma factor (TIGR02999 family)